MAISVHRADHRTFTALASYETRQQFPLQIGIPVIAWRKRWICSDCGHSWKPAALESASDLAEETIEAERSVHERRGYPGLRSLFVALIGLAILSYLEQSIGHRSIAKPQIRDPRSTARSSTLPTISRKPSDRVPASPRECLELPESRTYLERVHQRIIEAWKCPPTRPPTILRSPSSSTGMGRSAS